MQRERTTASVSNDSGGLWQERCGTQEIRLEWRALMWARPLASEFRCLKRAREELADTRSDLGTGKGCARVERVYATLDGRRCFRRSKRWGVRLVKVRLKEADGGAQHSRAGAMSGARKRVVSQMDTLPWWQDG
ncbi:hypothetical protein L1887_62170 [Cichorium endivia]|nr:hypothetical protein L1887_62170 [Cichorium endivia]